MKSYLPVPVPSSRRVPALLALCLLAACSDRNGTILAPDASLQVAAGTCFSRAATISPGSGGTQAANAGGGLNITGTAGDDVIVGSAGPDTIWGLDGIDRLCGLGSDDVLIGGPGADRLDGGSGLDVVDFGSSPAGVTVDLGTMKGKGGDAEGDGYRLVEGAAGSAFRDVLLGNDSRNMLAGRGGNDQLKGLGANDSIDGGPGNDGLFGGTGNDSIFGGAGNDVLTGGADDDLLSGDDDDDRLVPDAGAETISGGAGTDLVDYSLTVGPVTVDLTTGLGGSAAAGDTYDLVENVTGTAAADELTGDEQDNVLTGGDGNDVLRGAAGNDRLLGNLGDDVLHGDTDNTELGDDVLIGSRGADQLYGYGGADDLDGGEENDQLYGGPGDDSLSPGPHVNTVDGGAGTDLVASRSCMDTITNAEKIRTAACVADFAQTEIMASDASIYADGDESSVVTVQLKSREGENITMGSDWVVTLTTTSGLFARGADSAATMVATNNNDGTYSLTLVSGTTPGIASITASIDGTAATDNAEVTYAALGSTRTFDGTVDSDWHKARNWYPAAVPTAADDAVIPGAGTFAVTMGANAEAAGLTVDAGSTLGLGGFTLSAGGDVTSASTSNGTLALTGTAGTLAGAVPAVRVTGSAAVTGSAITSGPVNIQSGALNITGAMAIKLP